MLIGSSGQYGEGALLSGGKTDESPDGGQQSALGEQSSTNSSHPVADRQQEPDLAGPLLEVLAWGEDPRSFRWFEAPPTTALEGGSITRVIVPTGPATPRARPREVCSPATRGRGEPWERNSSWFPVC